MRFEIKDQLEQFKLKHLFQSGIFTNKPLLVTNYYLTCYDNFWDSLLFNTAGASNKCPVLKPISGFCPLLEDLSTTGGKCLFYLGGAEGSTHLHQTVSIE
ncbi:hypothetical protein XENOCAPTIV_012644 [Xenoophorus captivus]|uniref:Uncharacterized protein n=1 Tax=Xenoophorus captivus TaxID=1517983 RepID=A0ABV0QVE5_9TELE